MTLTKRLKRSNDKSIFSRLFLRLIAIIIFGALFLCFFTSDFQGPFRGTNLAIGVAKISLVFAVLAVYHFVQAVLEIKFQRRWKTLRRQAKTVKP